MDLKKLREKLVELKKHNSTQIKEVVAKASAQEQEYEKKILREKAILDKVGSILQAVVSLADEHCTDSICS